ncbi:MAG: hypothetical protein WDN24_01980 [Sphingomonas sp.]
MVTIPVSAFYAEAPVTNVVRFAFCKRDEVLDARDRAHRRVDARAERLKPQGTLIDRQALFAAPAQPAPPPPVRAALRGTH